MSAQADGHTVKLPELEGIVVTNLPSYAGGVNLWGNKIEPV